MCEVALRGMIAHPCVVISLKDLSEFIKQTISLDPEFHFLNAKQEWFMTNFWIALRIFQQLR
jgi:hypothetical protein